MSAIVKLVCIVGIKWTLCQPFWSFNCAQLQSTSNKSLGSWGANRLTVDDLLLHTKYQYQNSSQIHNHCCPLWFIYYNMLYTSSNIHPTIRYCERYDVSGLLVLADEHRLDYIKYSHWFSMVRKIWKTYQNIQFSSPSLCRWSGWMM
jgi:hypothetical protein